ncbi:MAG TPA: TonB-dependent receptor [Flavipsychrobacter sp.]|nr:TonB-dependent receptor [Flavipsychrobacter sp.]
MAVKNITIRYLFLLLLSITPTISFAQKKVTLSGYVHDSATGETMIGATIFIKEANQGAQTNAYGFYSVTVPAGVYTVVYSYVGYVSKVETMQLVESKAFDAELSNYTMLKEVEVTSVRKDANVKNTEMGTVTLSINRIKTLPVVFGEVDILKAIQLLPGVQNAGEGNTGFYVRGGGPDQNLVLLDEAVVYNTGHLFGFFSVFNSDAIKDVTLIKGGMPANYGGRLSSVLDVSMKDGNMKEYHAEGGIGLISSRLTVEGPIDKNKGSFMLSGRRTYIDVIAKPFANGKLNGSGYFFYDANLKANYKFNDKDRVFLSGYFGQDKFKFASQSGDFHANVPWGNTTATLRWNHQFNNKLFVNTSLIYNDYKFASNFDQNNFAIQIASGIKDYNAKSDFDYYTSFNHHFKAGVAYTYHTFVPNQVSGKADTTILRPDEALIKYAHEAGAYILDDFSLTKRLRVNAGIRYSLFAQVGPYTKYNYDPTETVKLDSNHYGTGEIVKMYGGFEPRLNLRYELDSNSSVKGSIAKTNQYIHLVTMNGTTLPTDVWVPSTYLVKPEIAWQYSLGYFRNFLNNELETSVEVYYKTLQNQIEYKDGYVPSVTQDPELSYVFGKGTAYGAEFFVNKTEGRFTGWLGYTLSWTNRQFALLNNGLTFPAKYDQRHDISLVGSYELNKQWTLSSVFVYGSGTAITLPTAYYIIGGLVTPEYSNINAYRLPAYHRLDISAIYTPHHKRQRRWQGSWAFSIYNVYDRHNPYFLFVNTQGSLNNGVAVKVEEVYLFPILPSITYNFKF